MYRLTVSGNYFEIVLDSDTDEVIFRSLIWGTSFKPQDDTITFYSYNPSISLPLKLSELKDENGDDIETYSNFKTWIKDNNIGVKSESTTTEDMSELYLGEEVGGVWANLSEADISDFTIIGSPTDAEITSTGIIKFTPTAQNDEISASTNALENNTNYRISFDLIRERTTEGVCSFYVNGSIVNVNLDNPIVFNSQLSGSFTITFRHTQPFAFNTYYIPKISVRKIIE